MYLRCLIIRGDLFKERIMELSLFQIIVLCCAFFIVECFGILLGFFFKEHKDYERLNYYRFIKTKNGILRLRTDNGEVYLFSSPEESKLVHPGKKFSDVTGSFNIENLENDQYILVYSSKGYFSFLNLS